MRLAKPLLAEFIGTFALIFIGAGAVTVLGANQIAGIALAHGLVIMAFAYAYGKDSGSYINPALVVAAVVAGEHSVLDAIPVILAQLLGGIAGAQALLLIYGPAAPHDLGATMIDLHRTTLMGGFALEAIGTFFLANTVLNAGLRGAAGALAPIAIGMTVTVCILAFGPITGGSVNPARTLGPAVAIGNYNEVGLYVVAQLLGGAVSGLLYRLVWNRSSKTVVLGERSANLAAADA
jgi:glycerol uptake facilitator-like aquaporin